MNDCSTLSSLHPLLPPNPVVQQQTSSITSSGSTGCVDPFGDRYAEVFRLGGGTMTDVYRCYDNECSRWVTLKALNPITGRRAEDRERFLREPKLMELIDHPSVPKIFGRFREQQPVPYFTMELIRGRDLCQILHGLRTSDKEIVAEFPLERLIDIVIAACEGIAAAHQRRILHRDIKPENIMVDEEGRTRIIDWGVAKPLCVQITEQIRSEEWSIYDRRRRDRLTRAGHQPGTLLYMSAEQATGLTELDERADVYSLGAVLYDCLALTTYVFGESLEEITKRIMQGPQLLPSQVTRWHSVPASLEKICLKALAVDREQRFVSVQEMRDALVEARMSCWASK